MADRTTSRKHKKAIHVVVRGVEPTRPGERAGSEPVWMSKSLNDNWKAVFHFGRNQQNALCVARVEILPSTAVPQEIDSEQVHGDGVTNALLQAVKLAPVRRYINATKPAATSGPYSTRGRMSALKASDYARLLAERDALNLAGDPAPAKTLHKKWGVNYNTMRTWLKRAAERR